jgi:hypothetical protein
MNVLGLLVSIETGRPSFLPLTWRRPPITVERMKRIQTKVDQMRRQGSSPCSSVSGSDPSTSPTIDGIVLAPPSPADRLSSASVMVDLCMGEALEQATKQIPLPVGLLETINDILHAVSVAKFVVLSENATKTEAEWAMQGRLHNNTSSVV